MGEFDPKVRFTQSPIARLATITPNATPHLVPVVFAVDPDTRDGEEIVYTAVDAKPKTTQRLRRLANIESNPEVSLLVDHYTDDWTQLWWVRVDGVASIHRDGEEIVYTAIDAKPKTTQRLRRLANIDNNPQASLLVDHYADDWTQLWWVRADGVAAIHRDGEQMRIGYRLLRAKYAQYQSVALHGPVIAITVRRWSSWHAALEGPAPKL